MLLLLERQQTLPKYFGGMLASRMKTRICFVYVDWSAVAPSFITVFEILFNCFTYIDQVT